MEEDYGTFVRLIELYQELMKMPVVDTRVIEAVIQVIMGFIPINVEVRINEIH